MDEYEKILLQMVQAPNNICFADFLKYVYIFLASQDAEEQVIVFLELHGQEIRE